MRVLLAIGCNEYEHVTSLESAEYDAFRIFNALVKPEVGQFDNEHSLFLSSPTIEQVRCALKRTLFDNPHIENFTFFFAGHGGVSSGSFHMWLRDTSPKAQSMTALSLSELFRLLNEASPKQSNVIIDACQSGGLISDLGVLLKPELIGDAGTPALTLVATSAKNQKSGETRDGGIGTNAILDCIEGRAFVQDNASVLDLVEIGRCISKTLDDYGQNAIVWGLNLYGPPGFCRNPRYETDPHASLRSLIHHWPASVDTVIRDNYHTIWSVYGGLDRHLNALQFFPLVSSVLNPCRENGAVLIACAERLAVTFSAKAAQAKDVYQMPMVTAGVAACLLPSLGVSEVDAGAMLLVQDLVEELLSINESLILALKANKFCLLPSEGGGFVELYQLPIRISKILGWAGAAFLCAPELQREKAGQQFSDILNKVLEIYSSAVIALSDAQAPHWEVTLAVAKTLDLNEAAEQLIGLLFNSVVICEGKLARYDIAPEKALSYLLSREHMNFTNTYELVEKPIETLSVILRAAKIFDLEDVLDEDLWQVDGLSFSCYRPTSYKNYSSMVMEGGTNEGWQIGFDVFRVEDFIQSWTVCCESEENIVYKLAIFGSLLLEDRVPWFCLDKFLLKH
ncbi:Peptidase C14 caspase catalytic subunit p20 [Pseudomonas syringae pv. coriandricola]|uniref:Peptidase C14 caspase catalytic subunit p20 n=1 Tax=Pseudomonas syringae pv. coriandricola TaxID=264453 RepID=A0A3M4TV96_9PSED|nr:caspase family protein [Pseudomonas syringae group genomosp. 3]RMR31021.1 Peptidase C14 caspase catalytic subunit p20 [Pseudomonas syringae pv. coriandricola]RMU09761.1 Peptidase C14 caspase catalytic subunit p20 [Pseudomonas syringae pv. coriandricola]